MTDERFDQLLNEMREESATPKEVAAVRERVLHRLSTSPACAEFRPELGAYLSGGLAGGLAEQRRLLVDDHLSRCSDCRSALAALQGEQKVVEMPRARKALFAARWTRWAAAAGIALVGLYAGRDQIDAALAPSGPRATVVGVSGSVYRLPQTPLVAGATLAEGEIVRTTAGATAMLELADGSRVEMNQRTELALKAAWSGQTVLLDRGDVIVQAAKQRRGSLRVVTHDATASVKGTVFGVSAGSVGSLVTVLEGSVAVFQPGSERVLTKGERTATNQSLREVSPRQAVSWSQDRERYYALLAELSSVEKELARTGPAPRTEAKLLRYLPANMQFYFAIPNLDGTIRQALFQFEQRTRENTVLGQWWTSKDGEELRQTLDRIQSVTPLLGEEVLFLMARDPLRPGDVPVIMAQVQSGRQDALRQALDRIGEGGKIPYRFTQDLVLISENEQVLGTIVGQLGAGSSTPFAAEIARRYQNGVGWLVAVDVASFGNMAQQQQGRMLGLTNMRYLFFEQHSNGGADTNEATLAFNGPRTGIASWLAAPGSAGSAEYVSAEAATAISASTKNPRQAFDELLALAGGDFATDLRKFESETGVSISADIASSLGTDFTFAIERVTLPIPGWVAAFEVVRPSVLDDTIRRLAERFNSQLPAEQAAHKLTMGQETVNGRTWMSLGWSGLSLHWTYDRGYMIASMDRAVAARAIQVRESGSGLVRSASFQQRFPETGGFHHSGFFWFNTSGVMGQIGGLLQATGLQDSALKILMESGEPVLVVVDGEMERIHAASRTRLTSLLLNMLVVHGAPGDPGPPQ